MSCAADSCRGRSPCRALLLPSCNSSNGRQQAALRAIDCSETLPPSGKQAWVEPALPGRRQSSCQHAASSQLTMTTPNRKGRLPRELNSLMCVPFSSRPNSSHTTTRMPAAWQTGTRQFFKRLSSRDDIPQQYGKSTGQLVPCMATGHGHRACHAGIISAAAKGRNGASGHRRQGACRVVRRGAYDTSMSSSCAGLASSGAGTAAHQAVSLELLQVWWADFFFGRPGKAHQRC